MRVVPEAPLRAYTRAVFAAAGCDPDEAGAIADHLMDANLAGHDSHGVIRMPSYLDWAARGMVLPNRHAAIVTDGGLLVVLDGGCGFGQSVELEAMRLAAERTRAHGLCEMGLRNVGHLGRIGVYAALLAEAGLVSVYFVNTSGFGILVAPHGGTDRRLSTNPIAAGAPGPDGPIVLDMATSASSEGKVQVARNKSARLPPGQLLDKDAGPSTDPAALYTTRPGVLLPLGGGSAVGVMAFEFFTPGLGAVLAAGGAEFVILDMEHGGAGVEMVKTQVACCRGAGLVPLVRVPALSGIWCARCWTPARWASWRQCWKRRSKPPIWCRFRPQGVRGLAFGIAHDEYRVAPAAQATSGGDTT